MTKGVIVDLVLLRINGGVLNGESAVWRVDIKSWLPAAVNYVVTIAENNQIKDEGDREMPSEFISYANLPILFDTEYYITLPVDIIPLRSNRGIRAIIDNCYNTYAPLRETAIGGLKRLLPMLGDKGLYWPKGKRRIVLLNKPKLADNVNAYYVANIDSYGDDDELPIPAGLESEVINVLYQYFTGERQVPADRKTDQRDLN